MSKKYISAVLICWFFILTYSNAQGDTRLLDLLTKLKLADHDTSRMDYHTQLADVYISKEANAEKGINHANIAIILAQNYGDRQREFLAIDKLIKGYYELKYDLKTATKYLNDAKAIDTSFIDITQQALIYGHEGKIFSALNDFEKSQNSFFKQLNIYNNLKDEIGIATVNFDVGALFFNQNNFTQALNYYEKALIVYDTLQDKRGKLKTLNALGQTYGQLKNYNKSLSYSSDALILAQALNDKLELAEVYANIGFAYIHLDRTLDALNNYNSAYQIGRELNNKRLIAQTTRELGNIYHHLCDEIQALDYYHRSLEAVAESDSKILEKNIFESLYKFHDEYGRDTAAYTYLKKLSNLKDELYNEERTKQLIANQIRYETEKQEEEVKLLRAKELQNNLTIQQQRLQNYALLIITLFVIVIAIILYSAFRRKKAYNDQLKDEVQKRTGELEESNKELKYFNTQLERSNNELERFAYIASHDLKSPLRNVISFLTLIERKLKNNPNQDIKEYLRFASDNARQMHNLIQDVLEFSRFDTQETDVSEVDLNESLMLVLQNLQEEMKAKDAVVFAQELPTIEANSVHILQLFQNLIGNGIKYNQNHKPRVIIGHRMDNTSHVFSFIDNGIGIDQEYYQQIFEMFKRLHTREEYSGTGIGLALCKKIINNLGGEIWLESTMGKGTTFFFSIPKLSAN